MGYQSLKIANGTLDAIYQSPAGDKPVLVLGHGAGANLAHGHMTSLADALAASGIGTLRFNFPFMQEGKRRVDRIEVCLATIKQAIDFTEELVPDRELYLAGHSFGGRMASHYMAETNDRRCQGLVYFSFPLHPSKKPDLKRAAHLPDINVPMLFLSGDRDTLADVKLLAGVIEGLPNAELHLIETADHSFKILKRTRQSSEDVYAEAARVLNGWLNQAP